MGDQQLRNFKDFLQLYNKVTELCFSSCADNFLDRNLSSNESNCVEKCVDKFARVNHSILGVYVTLQSELTQRRIAEYEAKQQREAEKQIIAQKSQDITFDTSATVNV